MSFPKGKSGNPSGRPKGSKNTFTIESFRRAVQNVEKTDKVNILEHFVRRALVSDRVLIVLINKLIPDVVDQISEWDEELLNAEIQLIDPSKISKEHMKFLVP